MWSAIITECKPSRSPSLASARMLSRVAVGPGGEIEAVMNFRRSVHSRQTGNRNARGARTPRARHPARIVRAVRAEIGLQQRELHQVELCTAATDSFEFAGNRFERVDRGGEISPFESGEGVHHRRNAAAGWVTALAREFVHLPCARLQCRPISNYGLRERNMHVGKGQSGAR